MTESPWAKLCTPSEDVGAVLSSSEHLSPPASCSDGCKGHGALGHHTHAVLEHQTDPLPSFSFIEPQKGVYCAISEVKGPKVGTDKVTSCPWVPGIEGYRISEINSSGPSRRLATLIAVTGSLFSPLHFQREFKLFLAGFPTLIHH